MTRSKSVVELPDGVAVVLDLDDTLYPERSFHESGFRWIANQAGLDPLGDEVGAASRALRRPHGRPLQILSQSTGVPVATLLDWHRSHPPDISLYPDAARFLHRASRISIPLVLLTDGRSVTQQHKIDALGIRHALHAILVSEETGFTKSDLNAYLQAAIRIPGRRPLFYVGDNPAKDVGHPTSLGWQVCLLLSRGDNVHPQPIEECTVRGAHVISTLDQVLLPP
jgi:putative hydrolase of the HAD superfamily